MNGLYFDISLNIVLYIEIVVFLPIIAMAPFESMEIAEPVIKTHKDLMAYRDKMRKRILRARWIPLYNIVLYVTALVVGYRYIRTAQITMKKFKQQL